MKRSSCRLRKVACSDCGYTARVTRSWLETGLPGCPCGGRLEPTDPADRAWIGLVGPEDMSQAAWNVIARDNGWPLVLNHGQHVQAVNRGRVDVSPIAAASKPQCAYPGCGRWTADGAERCGQHTHALEPAMPF